MVDGFGRTVDYLRVSVTDRCNLRCIYCTPEGWASGTQSPEVLTDAELVRLIGVFAGLGIRAVRITGGEPLTRRNLPDLIAAISALDGIEKTYLSTNGVLLAGQARALARSGLSRVNISLDTLKPERFREIARVGELASVLAGIEAALDAGLDPVKLNMVVVGGVNDDELGDFVALTKTRPLHVRFIELMPMGETGLFGTRRFVSNEEVRERIGPLEDISGGKPIDGKGPAVYRRSPGAVGTVGFISALSCNFCGTCNRMRLTSRGSLMACLDQSDPGTDLRGIMRSGGSDADLSAAIRLTVMGKPERHRMSLFGDERHKTVMCSIGG